MALVNVASTLQRVVANTPGLQWWRHRAFTAPAGGGAERGDPNPALMVYPVPLEVTAPEQYALPEGWCTGDPNEDIAGLRRIDPTLVMPFAQAVLDGTANVCHVDGVQCGMFSAHCTFCKGPSADSGFRCCTQCNRLMCRECYTDTPGMPGSRASGESRSADDRAACRAHNTIPVHPWVWHCDSCKRVVLPRWSNPALDYDLCLDCVTPEAKVDKGLAFAPPDHIMPLFGSLLEWLPLYEDALGNRLLYNGAVGSPRRGRWCIMCVDDRGRRGFHSFAASLPDLKAELEAAHAEWLQEYPDDVSRQVWNAKYLDAPLQRAVNRRQHMEKCYC